MRTTMSSDKSSDKKPASAAGNKKQGIAERIKQLDELVEWFYSPDFNLDQAVERYKQARELRQTIEQDLLELKNEITLLADETKA